MGFATDDKTERTDKWVLSFIVILTIINFTVMVYNALV